MLEENISAISTAPMTSGVAVIRISGDDPLSIAEKMFESKTPVREFEPYKMYVGNILADGLTDYGMCVYFAAPKSYTGENMVEFHCHGGIAITQAILKKTFALGARPATNGEFTKRAFMNGKLSLSSAEGLIEMINAESDALFKAGFYLYKEKLLEKVGSFQDKLKYVLAFIEANIDYPEDDVAPADVEDVKNKLCEVRNGILSLMDKYEGSARIKNGVKVVICGKPNAGKSSLLNAVLGLDKAIVTSVAGTTRDVVEGEKTINGVRFLFSDTAGIRESDDEVESLGIQRSKRTIESADIIVFVVDRESGYDARDEEVYSLVKDRSPIIVCNKSDLKNHASVPVKCDLSVSAKTGENIDALIKEIFDRSQVENVIVGGEYLTEERHYVALKKASEILTRVITSIDADPLDALTIELNEAWKTLGLISGETVTEAVIDEIFSKFCVGK